MLVCVWVRVFAGGQEYIWIRSRPLMFGPKAEPLTHKLIILFLAENILHINNLLICKRKFSTQKRKFIFLHFDGKNSVYAPYWSYTL